VIQYNLADTGILSRKAEKGHSGTDFRTRDARFGKMGISDTMHQMKRSMRLVALMLGTFLVLAVTGPSYAQAVRRPFGVPFDTPPGPSTWLLSQAFGNTTTAYQYREVWYGSGQGLHFGVDFSVPCGTEVVAIGRGVVVKVDASEHGSGPHNLLIRHEEQGYVSLYGHLLERPHLNVGQRVRRGEVVGWSGDPDGTCTSRPHLHLEIRSLNLGVAYNPTALIDADWDSLALVGPSPIGFQRDLRDPRQWQFMDDQPDVRFGGPLLNDYPTPWPPAWRGYS
jgi:murein DD-endopeptidase MepM/ murein hydrolase activator NlpD